MSAVSNVSVSSVTAVAQFLDSFLRYLNALLSRWLFWPGESAAAIVYGLPSCE